MKLQYLLHSLHQRKILEQTPVFAVGEDDTDKLPVHEEGDMDLNIDKILVDIGVCESDNEIYPHHFVFEIFSIIIIICCSLKNMLFQFKKR